MGKNDLLLLENDFFRPKLIYTKKGSHIFKFGNLTQKSSKLLLTNERRGRRETKNSTRKLLIKDLGNLGVPSHELLQVLNLRILVL